MPAGFNWILNSIDSQCRGFDAQDPVGLLPTIATEFLGKDWWDSSTRHCAHESLQPHDEAQSPNPVNDH